MVQGKLFLTLAVLGAVAITTIGTVLLLNAGGGGETPAIYGHVYLNESPAPLGTVVTWVNPSDDTTKVQTRVRGYYFVSPDIEGEHTLWADYREQDKICRTDQEKVVWSWELNPIQKDLHGQCQPRK